MSPSSIRISRSRRAGTLQWGVTLPELLLVMAIIGILSAMAVPRVWGLRDQAELRSATMRFTRAVMGARQAAIQRGERGYFKLNNNSVWVVTGSGSDTVVMQGSLDLQVQYQTVITDPLEFVTIEYDPRGVAIQPTQRTFHFRHVSGRQDSLCVSRLGNTVRKACP